jgi:hypothetical protein
VPTHVRAPNSSPATIVDGRVGAEVEGLLADRLQVRDTLMGPSDVWQIPMFAFVPFLMTSLISRRYRGGESPPPCPIASTLSTHRVLHAWLNGIKYVAQGDGPPRPASFPQSWVRQVSWASTPGRIALFMLPGGVAGRFLTELVSKNGLRELRA